MHRVRTVSVIALACFYFSISCTYSSEKQNMNNSKLQTKKIVLCSSCVHYVQYVRNYYTMVVQIRRTRYSSQLYTCTGSVQFGSIHHFLFIHPILTSSLQQMFAFLLFLQLYPPLLQLVSISISSSFSRFIYVVV